MSEVGSMMVSKRLFSAVSVSLAALAAASLPAAALREEAFVVPAEEKPVVVVDSDVR